MAKERKACLDNIMIAAPCRVSWESMQGDDRVRLCQGCSRNVYNISDMTRKEAEQFLAENGTTQCMQIYRRTDGTIMTDNCPVGLRHLRDRCRRAWKVAAAIVTLMLGAVPRVQADGNAVRGLIFGKSIVMPREAQSLRGDVAAIRSSTNYPLRNSGYSATRGEPVAAPQLVNTKGVAIPGQFVMIKNGPDDKIAVATQAPADGIAGGDARTTLMSGNGTNQAELVRLFLNLQGPSGGEDGTGLVKLSAQVNVNATKENSGAIGADFRALDLYNKARLFEDQGSLLNSLTHFREALKACIDQGDPDPVFKRFLEGEVERMSDKIKESAESDTDP